ncbi:MAG: hypothetical protein AB4426_25170 [Xenococcaceae cyanobacterium]
MKNYEPLVIPNPDKATKSCLEPQLAVCSTAQGERRFLGVWGGERNKSDYIVALSVFKNLSVCF